MALDIYIGTANAGKTGRLHERLLDHVRAGRLAALLLPTAPDVSRALTELAPAAPIGLTIETLGSFLDRQWEAIGDGRNLIRPVQRRILLEESVRRCTCTTLADSARTPGFIGMLERLVLRAAESTQEHGLPDGLGPAGELGAILGAYHDLLKARGLIEQAEAHRRVADSVTGEWLPSLIALNRVTDLTAAQERFVLSASTLTEVAVALTYDSEVPATDSARALVERLGCVGRVERVEPSVDYSSASELVAIERRLGDSRGPTQRSEGAVSLIAGWGEDAEAAGIVTAVQGALSLGIRPEGVAVAFRSPARHARALRAALDEAGIPAEWDLAVPIGQTGLGRAVQALVSFCSGPSERSAGLDFMRSPYCPAPDEGVDALDATLRRRRIADADGIVREAAGLGEAAMAMVREARRLCAGPLDAAALHRWRALFDLMLASAHGGAPLLGADGLLDCAASAALMGAWEQAVDLKTGWTAQQVMSAAAAAEVTLVAPERAGYVQVLPVERLRGRRFECVVIGGLTAPEFPRPQREDALLAPEVLAAFEAAGIDLAPRSDVAAERLLFYQAVTRAARMLVLSYQPASSDGAERERSIFIEELLDLYRSSDDGSEADPIPVRELGPDGLADDEGAPATERRALRGAAARGDDGTSEHAATRLAYARHRARPRAQCLSEEAQSAIAAREHLSVSDIEAYLQCPYRWYAERLLRTKELDAEVDAAAVGRLAHEVLARFYDAFVDQTGEPRVTPALLERAYAVFDVVAQRVLEETIAVGLAEEALLRRAVRNARTIVEADASWLPGFVPLHREWSFGLDDADGPVVVGGLPLAGRIDRIDSDGSRFVVIDYKSGTLDASWGVARFDPAGRVQLPLYAAVVAERLGLECAGAVYRSIAGGKPRGFIIDTLASSEFVKTDVLSSDGIAEAIDAGISRAWESVEGMRAGRVPAESRDGKCPEYCRVRPACPSRRSSDA